MASWDRFIERVKVRIERNRLDLEEVTRPRACAGAETHYRDVEIAFLERFIASDESLLANLTNETLLASVSGEL